MTEPNEPSASKPDKLVRGIGLFHATALNMIDMIGVGPFITLPLIVATLHGPQAMLGWILGGLLCMCDGLVWAELGAMMPEAGGPVRYLRAMYGPPVGRLFAFLFVWQLTFSAPLSMASGCIGFAMYASYIWPALGTTIAAQTLALAIPGIGTTKIEIVVTYGTFLAMGTAMLAILLLYRGVASIGKLASLLWVGVMGTTLWIVVSGFLQFDAARAFTLPPGAFDLTSDFFLGLGAAMLIAVYDYWGYYNVCYMGSEIRDPGRTIPRSIILSILGVATIYVSMNVAILGTMPWQEVEASKFVVSDFMQRVWGGWAGNVVTVLMLWTAFASVFSLLMGYSRVPYAAAVDGEYFAPFAKVHPRHKIPHISLLVLGGNAVIFCLFRLADVVTALVVIRILVQFLAQTVGVMVLRHREPNRPRPFRMWLYPLPAVMALLGFVYVLVMRPKSIQSIGLALVVVVVGALLFLVRQMARRQTSARDAMADSP
jgi:APA family basic amino acid/polyamine antiporter